jgi:hypothetical protein
VKQLHRCLLQPSTEIVSRLSENNHPTPEFKDPLDTLNEVATPSSLRLRNLLELTQAQKHS